MLRFKQFQGSGPGLETAINAWLDDIDPDVMHMVQSQLEDGAISLSFLFQESFRAQENRFAVEHGMRRSTTAPAPLEGLAEEPVPVMSTPDPGTNAPS